MHLHLWGPYRRESKIGGRYFLTIVDDYTRYTWLVLLKTKSQAIKAIKMFLNMVFIQFDKLIKIITTDNGTEFINSQCQNLSAKRGILHQKTCAYTPQQNGVVERRHRSILNIARSLLIQSGISTEFWGEAVVMAVNILNVLLSKVLNWQTPFYRLHR